MLVVILVGPPRVQGLVMLVVSPLGATLAPTLMPPVMPVKTRLMPVKTPLMPVKTRLMSVKTRLMPLQRLKRSRWP